MTIYRGPGGTGSASSDSDTTEFQEFLVQAEAARDAAQAAQTAAELAETHAETAETNAETAETNAETAATSAETAQAAAEVAQAAAETAQTAAETAETNAAASAVAAAASAASINDANLVHKTGDETVAGTKTFSSAIVGSVTGNAGNVTGTVAIANGGTGATSASAARTALGLAIGTDVQAYDATILKSANIGSTVQAYDADLTTLGAGGSAARSFLGLAIGTDVQAYDADLTTLGAGGSAARSFLGLAIGTDVQAYNANTAVTNVAQSFTAAQRGSITALTDGATITPNFALANNFSVTLGGNRTLANPSNLTAGQSGVIVITQDGTGSRTLAYGSYFKFANGTAPTLTTTASAVDVLAYYVESTTRITARLIGDVK